MDHTWFYLALLTAVIWGIDPILIKFGLKHAAPMTGLFVRLIGCLIGMAILVAARPQVVGEARELAPAVIAAFVVSGLLGAFLGHITNFAALRTGDVSIVMPVALCAAPMFTFMLAVLLYGEPVTLRKVAGAALVIAGVLLLRPQA